MMHTLSQIRHLPAATIGTTALLAFVAVVVAIAPLPAVKTETKHPSVERLALTAAPAVDRSRSVAPFAPSAFVRSSAESDSPPEGGIAGDVPGTCGDVTLTQSVDPNTVLVGNTIACASGTPPVTAENRFARSFPIAPGPNFVVNCVDFGVDSNVGGDFDVEVSIFTGDINGPYNSLTLLGSQIVTIPDGASGIFTADFAGSNQSISVPGGSNMIVEIHAPSRDVAVGGDGGAFFMGANDAGQTAPSYIRATDCVAGDFIDVVNIGFPDVHWLIRVDGGPMYYSTIVVWNDSGQDATDLHLTFNGAGGTLFVLPATVVALGCPNPVISTNEQITDTVEIDWGAPCVAPGQHVVFVVRSAQGPITYAGGFWTGPGGVPIGGGNRVTVTTIGTPQNPLPIGGGGGKPFMAVEVETRYRIDIDLGYTAWWPYPDGPCFGRWCCFDGRICEMRVRLCFYPDRRSRLLKVNGNCIVLVDWSKVRRIDGIVWTWVRTTAPFPGDPQVPPGGPIPDPPGLPPGVPAPDPFVNRVVKLNHSIDGGLTSYEGANFASAFFAMYDALQIIGDDPDLNPIPDMDATLLALGPPFAGAAAALQPLIDEMTLVTDKEPAPELVAILESTQMLQEGVQGIADLFLLGELSPEPFLLAQAALQSLGEQIGSLPQAPDRFGAAAQYFFRMAQGMGEAANQISNGLPQPELIEWGLIVFHRLTEFVAHSMEPHVRIQLDLDMPSWRPDEILKTHLLVQNAESGETLDESTVRLSEFGEIVYNPTHIDDGSVLRFWVKPGTFLAGDVDVPAIDGAASAELTVLPGDADGSNCIDEEDLTLVLDSKGLGGELAEVVPPADVTYNGVIDVEDVDVVQAGAGVCGVPYPGETKPDPCPADLTGDGNVGVPDLLQLLSCWGPVAPGCEAADLTGSGNVGVPDLLELLAQWGPCE